MDGTIEKTCSICGGTYTQAIGQKGRPREGHRDCLDLQSRLAQVQELLNRIEFQPHKAAVMAGDLFALRNSVQKSKEKGRHRTELEASEHNAEDPFCDCETCSNGEVN